MEYHFDENKYDHEEMFMLRELADLINNYEVDHLLSEPAEKLAVLMFEPLKARIDEAI